MAAKQATLRQDKYGNGIQILAPSGDVEGVTTSGTSQALAIPANAVFLRFAAAEDCYIKFGTSGAVTATADPDDSTLFPKGVEPFKVPSGATHVAVIQSTTGGAFQIGALI